MRRTLIIVEEEEEEDEEGERRGSFGDAVLICMHGVKSKDILFYL